MTSLDAFHRFDDAVDRRFESLRGNRLADRVFYAASEAANHSFLWHGLNWLTNGWTAEGRRRALRISAVLAVESVLVNGVVKSLFDRTRPVIEEERPHKLRNPRTSSFPSGHATSAFCAATVMGAGKRSAPLYYALAIVVSLSRIHVKIHHASDVVAGAVFGSAFGRMARRVLQLP